MKHKLDALEVFNAIYLLFEEYYDESQSESIVTMLSSMGFDEGMWDIWMEVLDTILDEDGITKYDHISALQAFRAIPLYLQGCYTLELFHDITLLVADIQNTINKQSYDSKIWKQWEKCFNYIASEEDINYRYRVNPLFNLRGTYINYSKNIHNIFSHRQGHLPYFLENEALMQYLIKDHANYRGVDNYGNALYVQAFSHDMQVWIYVRHIATIVNCGIATTVEEHKKLTKFAHNFSLFKKRGFSYEYKAFEPKK